MNLHLRRAVVGLASFCLLAASTATLAQSTPAGAVTDKVEPRQLSLITRRKSSTAT